MLETIQKRVLTCFCISGHIIVIVNIIPIHCKNVIVPTGRTRWGINNPDPPIMSEFSLSLELQLLKEQTGNATLPAMAAKGVAETA